MTTYLALQGLPLWSRMKQKRRILSFDLEVTARCNLDCRHCYINLPERDRAAQGRELTLPEIGCIADQAIELGTVWVLLTGGEPLLRPDFPDLYMLLKRKGLLVSVFTNGTLVHRKHVDLFRCYPPRDIEVTVYGVTAETYETVTRRSGSFAAFLRGLRLLVDGGVPVRLKAMALRSNLHEFSAITDFCRRHTKDFFRFDPQLHLRFDGQPDRNREIQAERLTPQEVAGIEMADAERIEALRRGCDSLIQPESAQGNSDHLFRCGAGTESFSVGYEGTFRLCSSLWAPGTTYDLRRGTLREAWEKHVPHVRDLRSNRQQFLDTCHRCRIVNLCMHCPAHAALETGAMDSPTPYFCAVAHAREEAIVGNMNSTRTCMGFTTGIGDLESGP